ncbi:MAG: guanylate kinase [Endomicrobium sp.]|nr:guanylate kinase [Endomicrobium sp.]
MSSNVIIISAPSGAGKSTICKAIVDASKNIIYSISYTTRLPRKGEKDGREYFFVSKLIFEKMINENKFVEWAKVHGHYYGTLRSSLHNTLKSGKNILLEIDVQGAVNIKKQYVNACMIFIMTPSLNILKNRLIMRNKESTKVINLRLKNAKQELRYIHRYEYLIINERLNSTIYAVKTILKSLKYRIRV